MNKNKIKNDFNEMWTNWLYSTEKLKGHYYIEGFEFIDENFKITLKHERSKQIIKVIFEGEIAALRIVEERYRLKLPDNISSKYSDSFFKNWSFFIVEKSEYLDWLSDESYETSNCLEVKHFVIIGLNYILDIASTFEPEIKIVKTE